MHGQGFASDVRITFSPDHRFKVPVGTLFKVWVTKVRHPTKPYLRSSGRPEEISLKDAQLYISEHLNDVRE